jgi:hypothetical protein
MAKRPTMPKSDPKIAALFERLLPTDERIVIRAMFGHKAAFVNGHMFSGTFGKHIFVRLDEPSRVELFSILLSRADPANTTPSSRTTQPSPD